MRWRVVGLLVALGIAARAGDSIEIHLSKHTTVREGSLEFADLRQSLEDIFRRASSTYRLAVTKELIVQVRRNGAIEAIYAAPKRMQLPNGASVEISRLLIPLEGRLAGHEQSVVFYGTPDYEEFNDVISPINADRVRELIAKAGKLKSQ